MSVKIVRQTSLRKTRSVRFSYQPPHQPPTHAHRARSLLNARYYKSPAKQRNNFFTLADSAVCYYATACNHCIPPTPHKSSRMRSHLQTLSILDPLAIGGVARGSCPDPLFPRRGCRWGLGTRLGYSYDRSEIRSRTQLRG